MRIRAVPSGSNSICPCMEDGCADLVTPHVHIELEALPESLCFTGVLMPGIQSNAKLCRLCPAKSKQDIKPSENISFVCGIAHVMA